MIQRLNPLEWAEWLDEPVTGYPKRPVPRDEAAATALKKRTLTNLYNTRPQWLADAREALDAESRSGPRADGQRDAASMKLLLDYASNVQNSRDFRGPRGEWDLEQGSCLRARATSPSMPAMPLFDAR